MDNKNVRLALAALFLNLAVAAHQVRVEVDGLKSTTVCPGAHGLLCGVKVPTVRHPAGNREGGRGGGGGVRVPALNIGPL